jgi:hypothetical protein
MKMPSRGFIIVLVAVLVTTGVIVAWWLREQRIRSSICACTGNMLHISSAKEQWAMAQGVTDGPADLAGISQYMKGFPRCILGGQYAIGDIGREPSCSVHGDFSVAHDGSAENIRKIKQRMKTR